MKILAWGVVLGIVVAIVCAEVLFASAILKDIRCGCARTAELIVAISMTLALNVVLCACVASVAKELSGWKP